jgi:hypothetical protein
MLRPEHVMFFDPDDTKVKVFINRFRDVADTEGEAAVLQCLPKCLKGDARDSWYSWLPQEVKAKMRGSLNEWEYQLVREYKKSTAEAFTECKKIKHDFGNPDLPLGKYLRIKRAALYESGIMEESALINYARERLDTYLQRLIGVVDFESWEQWCTRVKQAEPAAMVAWKDSQRERAQASKQRFNRQNRPAPISSQPYQSRADFSPRQRRERGSPKTRYNARRDISSRDDSREQSTKEQPARYRKPLQSSQDAGNRAKPTQPRTRPDCTRPCRVVLKTGRKCGEWHWDDEHDSIVAHAVRQDYDELSEDGRVLTIDHDSDQEDLDRLRQMSVDDSGSESTND